MEEQAQDWLEEKATVEEPPFSPTRPGLLGRLVVGFRTLWSQVATKWYVRPIVQQQNGYNQLVVARLREQEARLRLLDQTQATLTRETAELTTQLIQLNQLLRSIDARLADIEADAQQKTAD